MEKISLLLVDDHKVMREGLRSALEINERIEIVAEGENGTEAVELCKLYSPDIILMDIEMPERDGISASREIKKLYPETRIIILTMYDNKNYIMEALSTGIDGYLLKTAGIDDVHKAIKRTTRGENYFDPQITEAIKEIRKGDTEDSPLTLREREIVRMICMGKSSAEISNELMISKHTVNNHRANILSKLGIKKTAELVKYALETNLLG